MTNPASLTPEELAKRKLALNLECPGTFLARLIAALEAAWAENERLRDEVNYWMQRARNV